DSFINELKTIDWNISINNSNSEATLDANHMYSTFVKKYSIVYDKHFLAQSKIGSRKKIPRSEWITPGLVRCCITKSKLYKKYKTKPTIINENIYKKYKSNLEQILSKAEKSFYSNILESCYGTVTRV